jgi:hypothetical protein
MMASGIYVPIMVKSDGCGAVCAALSETTRQDDIATFFEEF